MKSMQPTSLLHLGTFWAKAEYENPTGSVKDRAAKTILEEAVRQGLLAPGGTVVEATSGNMGISLAAACAQMGCKCVIVMPNSMSRERRQWMEDYGAQVILTPDAEGMAGAVDRAETLAASIPGAFLPKQFENPANPEAHYRTTGPEVWRQTGGRVDIFVAGVGTGGTITGAGRFLKEQNPEIRVVAVEPAESPILSGGRAGKHGIQGIGAGFIPKVLDISVIDEIRTVITQDAFAAARDLSQNGMPVGLSSGAAAWVAAKIADENPGKRVVTVFPDSADRYGSIGL